MTAAKRLVFTQATLDVAGVLGQWAVDLLALPGNGDNRIELYTTLLRGADDMGLMDAVYGLYFVVQILDVIGDTSNANTYVIRLGKFCDWALAIDGVSASSKRWLVDVYGRCVAMKCKFNRHTLVADNWPGHRSCITDAITVCRGHRVSALVYCATAQLVYWGVQFYHELEIIDAELLTWFKQCVDAALRILDLNVDIAAKGIPAGASDGGLEAMGYLCVHACLEDFRVELERMGATAAIFGGYTPPSRATPPPRPGGERHERGRALRRVSAMCGEDDAGLRSGVYPRALAERLRWFFRQRYRAGLEDGGAAFVERMRLAARLEAMLGSNSDAEDVYVAGCLARITFAS